MKRRKLQFLLLCLIISLSGYAEKVTQEQALQKAQRFMQDKSFTQHQKSRGLKRTPQAADFNAFYIFNVENNGGFVIVSGDDRTKDILGYSEHGNIDLENAPSNVRWWLGYYEKAIKELDKATFQHSLTTKVRKRGQKNNIEPFITTTWGQGAPYNALCPIIDGKKCLTGCVATAMAQVMNYLKCPEGETGGLSAYSTTKYGIWVEDLPPTSFDWDNMTNDDIARLMRYCGQAVQMDYGLIESGAYEYEIPFAMKSSFGFDNEIGFAYPSGFGDGWEDFIYEELVEGRPVIYGAQSDMGRHSFICNGYKEGKFYINWGWNGDFDGYYELSVLDVSEEMVYNTDHCAIVHIMKSTGTPIEDGDGRVFTAESPEGITLTFSVVSESGKTCRVGYNDDNGMSAIDEFVTGTLTVPSEVDGYRVVTIGESAFFRNNLNEIILPESITKIFGTAFRLSFELSSITIPKNVSFIPNYGAVFSECPKLREIIVDKDNPVYDSRENCNAVIHTETNQLVVGCGGTTIPRSVTSIAPQALMDCYGMETLFIHKDLIDIGSFGSMAAEPFWGCPDLESIIVEEGNPYYASPNNCNVLVDLRNGELILGCSNTVIPKEVTFISNEAFFNNKKLRSIVIPEGVTALLSQTFTGCENLEEVTLPSTLTYMAGNDFSQCNLKSIHIPDGITSLHGSFWENKNLATFTGGKNLVEIGNGTFSGCAFESFTIGDKVETIGDAFERCHNLKSIVIPKGVKSIGREAFKSCYSMETMSVEEGNTIYDSRNNCNAIIETATNKMIAGCKNTTFPEGLKSIADRCFWECSGLKELNLPNTLNSIGNYAFGECKGLTTVTLPNSIVRIGNGAFLFCLSLKSVVLPKNLKHIPSQTFELCIELEEVYCKSPIPPTIEQGAFESGKRFPHTLYVPVGSKDAYQEAPIWCDFEEIIEMDYHDTDPIFIDGDVTINGSVDVQDATIVVNYILGKENNAEYNYYLADINNDDEVDVFDVTAILNIILSNGGNPASARSLARQNEAWEPICLTADGNELLFGINNPERFTSFQFDVEVPQSVDLLDVEWNSNTNHLLQFAKNGDNHYTVVALSLASTPLPDFNDALLRLHLSERGEVRVDNVLFVTPDGKTVRFNGATTSMSTGIKGTSNTMDEQIFDISGRRLNTKREHLGKGVYIINNKKVVIK
jgi:hypothetical protein